eukprot:2444693-Alexandrium_andersonii.AAC.1
MPRSKHTNRQPSNQTHSGPPILPELFWLPPVRCLAARSIAQLGTGHAAQECLPTCLSFVGPWWGRP